MAKLIALFHHFGTPRGGERKINFFLFSEGNSSAPPTAAEKLVLIGKFSDILQKKVCVNQYLMIRLG